MRRLLSIIFVFSIILSACGPHKKLSKHTVLLDTVVVKPNPNLDIYRGSATKVWDISHTKVALSFDLKEKTANGKAWIDMHPYFYATDTLVLDAKGMHIDTAMIVTPQGNRPVSYSYENNELKFRFAKEYKKEDSIRLYIRYTAMPYSATTGGSHAITDDRGLYFINTDNSIPNKPVQIWTQGETESNSHWLPTIDKPNERFTIDIELTVPDSFQTLSNGYMVKQTAEKNGLRTDVWKMDMPIQAYAVMFAIGHFTIVKDSWHGKDVNYYVEPAYGPYASKIFKNTPEMMSYFSDITGILYPWNKYDQVIVRDYVSGAMENTTASLFGEFMNETNRELMDRDFEDVVSHELFHQWFGDYVTCESWSNITVNESFANYSEQLWRGHKYGKASSDKLAYEDLHKYLQSAKLSDPPLVRFYYNDREDVFDRISYEKGGAVLNYLKGLMGDEVFFKAMNIYLSKNALHCAEAQQWRLAIEDATGTDWNWFFNQWYYRGGHPVLDVMYDYDDDAKQLIVTVAQKQTDSFYKYQLPLKAAIIYGNEKNIADWDITSKKETFIYPYKDGQKPVIIPDAMHWLPGELNDNKIAWQWLAQYRNSDDYINKRVAILGAARNLDDSSSQILLTEALADNIPTIKQYTLDILQLQKKTRWQDKWKEQIAYMALNDGNNAVRASAFDVLGDWKIKSAIQSMIDAVNDSSYNVSSSALAALYKISEDTAYDISKRLLASNPGGDLELAIWSIIGKKGYENDINFFEQKAPYVYGTRKFSFVSSIYYYLLNVKSDVAFEKGVALIAKLAMKEPIKTYRPGLASYLYRLAQSYDSKAKTDNKTDAANDTKRIEIIKAYIDKIVDAEKDADNLKTYKSMKTTANEFTD